MTLDSGIPDVRDTTIFPDGTGKVIVYLDKESLLARLTDGQRSERKQAVVDRFFELSADRAYYFTDAYVVAELVSAFRAKRGAQEAVALYKDIKQSSLRVLHGADSWTALELTKSPQNVLDAAAEFIVRFPKHDVSLQEATLIIQAKRGDNMLFSFDGPIRKLGLACDLTVLPYTESAYMG